MQCETLYQLAALNEKDKVVHLFLLEDLIKPRTLTKSVVIMDGDKGHSQWPLTQACRPRHPCTF